MNDEYNESTVCVDSGHREELDIEICRQPKRQKKKKKKTCEVGRACAAMLAR